MNEKLTKVQIDIFVAKKNCEALLLVTLVIFLGLSVFIYFWDVRWQPQKLTIKKSAKNNKYMKKGEMKKEKD